MMPCTSIVRLALLRRARLWFVVRSDHEEAERSKVKCYRMNSINDEVPELKLLAVVFVVCCLRIIMRVSVMGDVCLFCTARDRLGTSRSVGDVPIGWGRPDRLGTSRSVGVSNFLCGGSESNESFPALVIIGSHNNKQQTQRKRPAGSLSRKNSMI